RDGDRDVAYGTPKAIVASARTFVERALAQLNRRAGNWSEIRRLLYRAQDLLRPPVLNCNPANFYDILFSHWQKRIHESIDLVDNENATVAYSLLSPVQENMRKFVA